MKISSSQPSQCFELEAARGNGTLFIRMESVLPPRVELAEGTWDEHLPSGGAQRELFMRLLRAEARWDSLMGRWPCVIFSQRPDFSLQMASPNIEELTGIPQEVWSSQSRCFWQILHEADAPELQRQFTRAVQTGTSVTNTFRIRNQRTGRVIYILEHRQPTVTQNNLLLSYEVIWLDVTRQTIAEKRLSTTAWKETLGVLTMGMAHDFRNMMAGIQSLSEDFLDQLEPNHPFGEGLSLIKRSCAQANQLVNAILNLHLGQAGECNYHNLNEVASELVDLVGKILPRRIQVVKELTPELLPIYIDLVELRQAIINLLINAADSMPDGGTLTLRTSHHTDLSPSEDLGRAKMRPPCVCLSIQDTGCGIKERHLNSIFDPFFTTKSKGSGLGLYNTRLAVEKHRGSISVDSKVGQGTTFHIWFPEADFSEGGVKPAAPGGTQNTRKSLLLFGQPGEMVDRTAEFLRSNDYHVVITDSADGVSELVQSSDYHFSGVMLLAESGDRSLPQLLKQLRRDTKHLKAIVNSGRMQSGRFG